MKKLITGIGILALSLTGVKASLVITGVIDGPLTDGLPKAIELYALSNIADLSLYAVGSANNGEGSDGAELTLSGSATAGDFLYIATESTGFNSFFGFDPDYTSSAANINGDDAIELFSDLDNDGMPEVIDIFGDINVDGTGEDWEYLDGWAYRDDQTGPDGPTFTLASWSFSGINALDGETTNAGATTPFPIGTYTPIPEPSTWLLFGAGVGLVIWRLRRRK